MRVGPACQSVTGRRRQADIPVCPLAQPVIQRRPLCLPAVRRQAGRRRIYCGMGPSPRGFYVSIPERRHVCACTVVLPASRHAGDVSAPMCLPRCRVQDNREDGRFFAALRMTCFVIAFSEVFRSSLRQYCCAEEAEVRVGQTFLSARSPHTGCLNTGISTSSMTTFW